MIKASCLDGEEITRTRRLNPGMHIPAEATAVHGITDDDVKECPTFAQVAKSLEQFIRGCDFGRLQLNRFDLPVPRGGVPAPPVWTWTSKKRKFIDVQNIFHKKEQRTLVAAYRFYCDKALDDAHSAEADTRATYEVLKGAAGPLSRDLENDVAALADFSARGEAADYAGRILYNDKGEEVFGFGKYKGTFGRRDLPPRTELLRMDDERRFSALHQKRSSPKSACATKTDRHETTLHPCSCWPCGASPCWRPTSRAQSSTSTARSTTSTPCRRARRSTDSRNSTA